MSIRLGFQCKLYRNSAPGGDAWTEMKNISDVECPIEGEEIDATVRDCGGFKGYLLGLIDAGIEFDLKYDAGKAACVSDFEALIKAFFQRADIEIRVLDGTYGEEGVEGLQMTCKVTKFPVSQPMAKDCNIRVAMKPSADAASSPVWIGATT